MEKIYELDIYQLREKNKLLAEYLGYQYFPYQGKPAKNIFDLGWKKPKIPKHGYLYRKFPYYLGRRTDHLYFHCDWKWFMMLVDKIYKDTEEERSDPKCEIFYLISALKNQLISADLSESYKFSIAIITILNKKNQS